MRSRVDVLGVAHQVPCHCPQHCCCVPPAGSLCPLPLSQGCSPLGDASSHWRFLLPSFLRWLSSDLCTRKHSFKFWARILGFRISSPIELGNQPLSWS